MIGGLSITATAGCLTSFSRSNSCSNEGSFSLDEATETGISNEFSTPLDGLPYATQIAVTDALDADSGESTSRGYYSPNPRTDFVVTGPEAHYYRLETTDHDGIQTTGYEYSVEIGVDESKLSDGVTVRSFRELPIHDRESLRGAIGNPGLLHAPHYTSFSVVFAYEHTNVQAQSVFIPERATHYLEWDETLLRLAFEEQRTVVITSTTVSTELVATSPDGFKEHIGNNRGVLLDSLTTHQQDIVAQAIDGTYTECEPYSEPFSDLRERLSVGDDGVVLLVQYDSDWYFCHLH
ncbi:hypothetical protein [Halopenitus persicus]|uniref:Uncharacterized protein n=1 Tax=Halopenitus persicus TaxID=1048396 RepID=A0A1H3NWU3_9EURY|nr:hypothetical protein [Halopenitus persicus]SDY93356.1 hypothetical protein SAMN05216564_11620 [Halopenitus persicus]